MPLLNGPHDDEATAALSITANRASKIDKLIEDGNIATARTFAAALLADVLEWAMIGKPGEEKARLFVRVGETAFQAYVRAREARTEPVGDGETIAVPCRVVGRNNDGDLARLEVIDGASWPGPETVWLPFTKLSELKGA